MNEPAPDPCILAIETSAAVASVALYQGASLLSLAEVRQDRSHARVLMPMIQDVLSQVTLSVDDLSAVAVASGPGSYTGLRVGVSAAKGLCYALGIPLLRIGTLDALAAQVTGWAHAMQARICPLLDARRAEVYVALFDADLRSIEPVQPLVVDEHSFTGWLSSGPIIFVGDGVNKCLPFLKNHPQAVPAPEVLPSAANLGKWLLQAYQQGDFQDLMSFEPFYLKDIRITTPKNKLVS